MTLSLAPVTSPLPPLREWIVRWSRQLPAGGSEFRIWSVFARTEEEATASARREVPAGSPIPKVVQVAQFP